MNPEINLRAAWHRAAQAALESAERLRQAALIRERMRAHCAARYAGDEDLRAMFAELHTVLEEP